MHNPESVQENETHKVLWVSEIQTGQLISVKRPDLVIVNIKMRTWTFVVPADHSVKLKESENKDKYLDLARKLKKTVEHESDVDTNCN